MAPPLKNVLLERCIQLMIGGLKNFNLAWVNKIAVIGCTWLFVYETARTYEGGVNAAPGHRGSQLPTPGGNVLPFNSLKIREI